MVNIKVTTTGFTVDGQTEVTAKVPLAAAIRKAEEFPEGAIITVASNLTQPINVGGPAGNQNKDDCAYWKTKPISNVTIQGLNMRSCSISNVTFWQGLNGINDIFGVTKDLNEIVVMNDIVEERLGVIHKVGHKTGNTMSNHIGTVVLYMEKAVEDQLLYASSGKFENGLA